MRHLFHTLHLPRHALLLSLALLLGNAVGCVRYGYDTDQDWIWSGDGGPPVSGDGGAPVSAACETPLTLNIGGRLVVEGNTQLCLKGGEHRIGQACVRQQARLLLRGSPTTFTFTNATLGTVIGGAGVAPAGDMAPVLRVRTPSSAPLYLLVDVSRTAMLVEVEAPNAPTTICGKGTKPLKLNGTFGSLTATNEGDMNLGTIKVKGSITNVGGRAPLPPPDC